MAFEAERLSAGMGSFLFTHSSRRLRRGLTKALGLMGFASLVLTLGLASGAPAEESWQFVFVSRGTDLTVREGTATLTRSNGVLTGVMLDTRTVEYSLNLTIQGGDVSGTFGAIESDDGGTLLRGTDLRRNL